MECGCLYSAAPQLVWLGRRRETTPQACSKILEFEVMKDYARIKVTGNALNIEYYFWWRDDCFVLLIHHDAQFHFMVSISDEYKYKRLVKTTFKSCGKLTFLEFYHTRN